MDPLTKCIRCSKQCSIKEPSSNTGDYEWVVSVLSTIYACVNDHVVMVCKLCDNYIDVKYSQWVDLFTHIINVHWRVWYDGFYGYKYLKSRDGNYRLSFEITFSANYHFIFLTGDCNSAIVEFNNSSERICYGRKTLAKYLTKCIICGMFYECPPVELVIKKHIIAAHLNSDTRRLAQLTLAITN